MAPPLGHRLIEWVLNLCSVWNERASRGYCPCEHTIFSKSQAHETQIWRYIFMWGSSVVQNSRSMS